MGGEGPSNFCNMSPQGIWSLQPIKLIEASFQFFVKNRRETVYFHEVALFSHVLHRLNILAEVGDVVLHSGGKVAVRRTSRLEL